jgi:hypothetical protein
MLKYIIFTPHGTLAGYLTATLAVPLRCYFRPAATSPRDCYAPVNKNIEVQYREVHVYVPNLDPAGMRRIPNFLTLSIFYKNYLIYWPDLFDV